MGKITKIETRNIAKELKLNVFEKPESQDICFVPNGDYASVIMKYKPESFKEGNIVDLNKKILGKHDGIINYTIGQRKGIRISDKEPLYVIKINSQRDEIIVGPKSALGINNIYLKDLNLLNSFNEKNEEIFIKVRSTGKLLKAKVKIKKDKAEILLKQKENGVSPGQACVFYSKNKIGDKLLGGGWIEQTS